MSYDDPARNGVHAPPKSAPVPAPRLDVPDVLPIGRPRRRGRPWAWLVLAAAWLWLAWFVWQDGYRSRAGEGGMTKDEYWKNVDRGREILDGVRERVTSP